MSAPLVVNTKDGGCWTRRTVTEGGVALYALADVCKCPEFVMATLAELAEHGISGSADALPMPMGPEPRTLDVVENELTGANLSLYEEELDNARLRLALASARRGRRELRARVAELEAERHVTNEALSDAAVQLRANADRIAELEALKPAPIQTCRKCGAGYTYGEPCSTCAFKARMAAEVEGITVRIAPTQALSLEDPHDSPLHHTYLKGRDDLPPFGGAPC